MAEDIPPPGHGYWYEGQPEVQEMLEAFRRFRNADQDMRRHLASDMDMNVPDLEALQHVIEAERAGEPITPGRLAEVLGISTASTTKLVDRLTAARHVIRQPHPTDRRSVVLLATAHAHAEVRARLAEMHRAMADAALAVPTGARRAVIDFLGAMAAIHGAEPVAASSARSPRPTGHPG